MRLLYVVQRYGESIAGGAEQHCREFAERLAARGHDVEVATTCAESYVNWTNVFAPGPSEINSVQVHRFPVAHPRTATFDADTQRLHETIGPRPLAAQRAWIEDQGPYAPELVEFLAREHARFDCVAFFTYLYWPTWMGLRIIAGATPCVLHPTAHPEPALGLTVYDEVFRLPDALAYSTPEEVDLVRARCAGAAPGAVIGIGFESEQFDGARFREAFPVVGDAPYLLYVGRVDPGKGAIELLDDFDAFVQSAPTNINLVLLGEPVVEVPQRPNVVVAGFVAADIRDSALAGALALVQPSRFESFSMVIAEAFAQGRPALVQRQCAVTRGHVTRSGGGIAYDGAIEFAEAVRRISDPPVAADTMGDRGRRYVQREFAWDVVLDRYERLLDGARADGSHGAGTA